MYVLFNKIFNLRLHVVFPKENSLTQYWRWTILEEWIHLVQGIKLLARKELMMWNEGETEGEVGLGSNYGNRCNRDRNCKNRKAWKYHSEIRRQWKVCTRKGEKGVTRGRTWRNDPQTRENTRIKHRRSLSVFSHLEPPKSKPFHLALRNWVNQPDR